MTGEEYKTHPSQASQGKTKYKPVHKHTKNPLSGSIGQPQHFNSFAQPKHKNPLPLPKGESAYALAKIAEYQDRNLEKAEFFYKQAIHNEERVESAIKDLASLLHQKGETKKACEVLLYYKSYFTHDKDRYENLFSTLQKQINNTGNSLNKFLKVSGLSPTDTMESASKLFTNSIRIQSVELGSEEVEGKKVFFALIKFNSHSSARKTLEGFHSWERYKIEWISVNGESMGDAHYARHKMEEHRKVYPAFDYSLFERDPEGYVFCMPLDGNDQGFGRKSMEFQRNPEDLIGTTLFSAIFQEVQVECN